ncbi:hypothetical protein D3C87_2038420 [compost metagenome]
MDNKLAKKPPQGGAAKFIRLVNPETRKENSVYPCEAHLGNNDKRLAHYLTYTPNALADCRTQRCAPARISATSPYIRDKEAMA